jgi:hypothetical protein
MWEPRRLTTLWASTACYRDSFTFFKHINTGINLRYIVHHWHCHLRQYPTWRNIFIQIPVYNHFIYHMTSGDINPRDTWEAPQSTILQDSLYTALLSVVASCLLLVAYSDTVASHNAMRGISQIIYAISTTMVPAQPNQTGTGGSFPGDKAAGTWRWPTSVEFKKTWIYTSTPPYVFLAQCLIN